MNKYADKKAVVIGGTHGMGLATVNLLLDGGAKVMLTGLNQKNNDNVQREHGDRVHVLRSDVGHMADIAVLADEVSRRLGQIDFLYINAAVAELESYDAVTEESYDRQFDINTRGAFFTVQRLAPLIRDGGAIVFMSSVADVGAESGMSVYSATKAALVSLASGFAAELLPRGIRVNTVSPGFIKIPTHGVAGMSDDARRSFEESGKEVTPMKRNGTPDEVARAVLFLAFDAIFTTGAKLPVDGGLGQGLTPPCE